VSLVYLFSIKGLHYMSSCGILISESGSSLARVVVSKPAIAGSLIKGD